MEKNKFLKRILTVSALFGIILSFVAVLPALADSNRGHHNRGRGNGNNNIAHLTIKERDDENEERFEVRGFNNVNKEVQTNVVFENKVGNAISGTAKISVFLTKDNLHDTKIKAKIRNISSTSTSVFEGWLIDNDSGFKLSLGAFRIEGNGQADLNFKQLLVNFKIYDKLVVTEEPMNDTNPNPSTVILEANISNIATTTPPPVITAPIVTTSVLNGSNEVPATTSPATGFGVFVINTDKNTVDFHIIFSGLSSAETAAHIHGFALPGANAPILFTLPLGSPKNGVWNYLESQEADILAGKTYVNIHSTAFPDGEIRGQIKP